MRSSTLLAVLAGCLLATGCKSDDWIECKNELWYQTKSTGWEYFHRSHSDKPMRYKVLSVDPLVIEAVNAHGHRKTFADLKAVECK